MDLLLDTHAAWWFLNGNKKMPDTVKETILTTDSNMVKYNINSLW